jgi:hypothetical protein
MAGNAISADITGLLAAALALRDRRRGPRSTAGQGPVVIAPDQAAQVAERGQGLARSDVGQAEVDSVDARSHVVVKVALVGRVAVDLDRDRQPTPAGGPSERIELANPLRQGVVARAPPWPATRRRSRPRAPAPQVRGRRRGSAGVVVGAASAPTTAGRGGRARPRTRRRRRPRSPSWRGCGRA